MIVNKKSIYSLKLFTDIILLNLCFILSAVAAQSWEILISRTYIFILLFMLNILWKPLVDFTKLYNEFINRSPLTYIINAFKITLIQITVAIFFIFLSREDLFTRIFIIYFFSSLFIFLFLKQIVIRKSLKYLRKKGKSVRSLAIIGEVESAQELVNMIKKNPELGFNFKGYITEVDTSQSLGTINNLEQILTDQNIETLLITLSTDKSELIKNTIRVADRLAIANFLVPDYSKFISTNFELTVLGDIPIFSIRKNSLDEFQAKVFKRVSDILLSSILFITILWWLLPLISLIIKIESKGTALFIQDRIGLKNKKFRCYKFRTMTSVASKELDSTKATSKNDNRVTKIGKILRKSNLDELPQILNVLKGNMSFVGPRPHAIPFDKLYSDMIEEIKLRHRVKPGITGWAQIHKLRGDVDDPVENQKRTRQRIEFDIWYIENWSYFLDIKILLITIFQIFSGKNSGI